MAKSKKAATSEDATKTSTTGSKDATQHTAAAETAAGAKLGKTNARKKAPGKSAAAEKSTGQSGVAGMPQIDTSLAAAAAARLVGAKVAPVAPASADAKKESAGFKQLKDSLHNPLGGGLGNALDKSGGSALHKSNLPFGGAKKQAGHHNQTSGFGSRTNLPRRTGG